MRPARPLARLLSLAAAVAAALLIAPAAQAQDCLLPGSEQYATEPVCNIPPTVTINPPSTSVGQPQVPVTLEASDHYSDNDFASFRILLDGNDVTPLWSVTVTEGGWGTGTSKTFRASGTVALSTSQPQRSLQVKLCDVQWCTNPTSTFTLAVPGVEVTPDGAFSEVAAAASRTHAFTVTNRGTQNATFSLQAACRTTAAVGTCTATVPGSLTLAAGASQAVNATYPAPQVGSVVSLLLTATQNGAPGVTDAGWAEVTVRGVAGAGQAPFAVELVPLNAGTAVERSQCVTAAAGPGAAYECGDLRLAHALPAHRTVNRTWAPVLLYNSQHAAPRPTVYADLTLPANAAAPNWMNVAVTVNGVRHDRYFSGSDFAPGATRRIGVQWDGFNLPTGAYPYTLEVVSWYAGGSVTTSVQGEITVVNRSGSPFGAGWWLAGWEQLIPLPDGARFLWVGGDGSTRIYTGVANDRYVAPSVTRPDTLYPAWVNGQVHRYRRLPGRTTVWFNAVGEHYATYNALGQNTTFEKWGGVLRRIVPPGGGTAAPQWVFDYGPTGALEQATAMVQGAPNRPVVLERGSGNLVTALVDPDNRRVTLEYAQVSGRPYVGSRIDRRNTRVQFGYGDDGKLRSARIHMQDAAVPDITSHFHPAESRGVSWHTLMASSVSLAQSYTLLDGPRTDVQDHTWLWLGRWGAPERIRDAMGAETIIKREDARFPLLATRVESHTGVVSTATYDTRGRVVAATTTNAFGGGESSTTTYAWDNACDRPTETRAPGVDTVFAGYDQTTCNVLWQRQGRNTQRQVDFVYHPAGHAHAGQLHYVDGPVDAQAQRARETVEYDAQGNLRKTISPLGFLSLHLRDALGRDTLTLTPTTAAGATTEANLLATGVRQRTQYDVMDRPTHTWTIGPVVSHTPAGGLVPFTSGSDTLFVVTGYDDEGRPLQVTRWASPDTARVHTLMTSYTYDAAGRKKTESDGFSTQTYGYDPAGNVSTWTTPRGHQVTSEYDALNRLVRRVVPTVTYARACANGGTSCPDPYPHHPNGSNGSLVIPEEWTTFRFDLAGNMVHAENGDAIVRRGYYPGGALKTDSLRIRSLNGVDFNSHVYGLTYGYNTATGQLTSMQHPLNLAGSQALDQYGYHPITGALAAVTGRTGHAFDFTYAPNGQMVRLRGPAYSDTMVYDLEGRLVRRVETASVAGTLHDDTYTYDARGKLMQVAVGATTGRSPSTYRQYYSGSGMLIATDWQNEFDSGRMQELFAMDAMGNTAWRRAGDGSSSAPDSLFRNAYDIGRGRLATIDKLNMGVPSTDFYPNRTERRYDASGNVDWAFLDQKGELGDGVGTVRWKGSRSFYAADERLRYFQERDLRGGTSVKHDGVWEEYRYDPLGRRILVNTRTKNLCTTGTAFQCASATTRMVWAGDQLIWELRQASESPGEVSGPSDAYGTVGYMHAGGIDRPLVITKNGESVLPHQNWRGQFSRGTYANGASSDCAPGQNYNCAKVAWPGWRTTAWHVDAKDPDIRTWWGGLVDGMRDVSGQMYMRNRYYDPATGQFTQQDPIGIAGGLNTYGFANGDPVSYSDPYGLSAEAGDPPWWRRMGARVRQLVLPAAASAVVQGETLAKNLPESMTPPAIEERVTQSGSGQTTRGAQSSRTPRSGSPGGGPNGGTGGGGGRPPPPSGGAASGAGGPNTARALSGRVLGGLFTIGGVIIGIAITPDEAGSAQPAVCTSTCLYQE